MENVVELKKKHLKKNMAAVERHHRAFDMMYKELHYLLTIANSR